MESDYYSLLTSGEAPLFHGLDNEPDDTLKNDMTKDFV